MHIRDFLASPPDTAESWQTGIAELDRSVGGFRRGQVWVLTGAPATGKSALLTQLVHVLGVRHGFEVLYHCSRVEHPDLTRARLLSLAVKRSPALPHLEVPLDGLTERQRAALDALRTASIEVVTGGGFTIPDWQHADGVGRCLAIDDPEGKRPPVLAREIRTELRAVADRGAVVMVTVPRSLCLERSTEGDRLREQWASVADVVVELVPGEVGAGVLRLWQNRRGPVLDLPIVMQWHLGRVLGVED